MKAYGSVTQEAVGPIYRLYPPALCTRAGFQSCGTSEVGSYWKSAMLSMLGCTT